MMWRYWIQQPFLWVTLVPLFCFVSPLIMNPANKYGNRRDKRFVLLTLYNSMQMDVTASNFTSSRSAEQNSLFYPIIDNNRMNVIHHLSSLLSLATIAGFATKAAIASATETMNNIFRQETDEFRYQFQIPPDFIGPSQKPLKTHLDEVNFKSTKISGYEIGITVDPVRITSLRDFGTPEEVAAKVVLAEVNRDGVMDVELVDDPASGTIILGDGKMTTFYQLNYRSNGKRGIKRYVAKFYVNSGKLYAFTVQCKEDAYNLVQQDINDAVSSFRVI